MPHTILWDAAYEAVPADTDLANTLGDVVRDLKRDIRERAEIDHDWDDTTNAGKHNKVTLQEQGADPGTVANEGFVYTKDVGGVTELFYKDSAGTVKQLTTAGFLNFTAQDLTLDNDKALRGKEVGGTVRDLAKVDASDRAIIGSASLATMRLQATTLAGIKAWDGVTERDVVAYPKGYLSTLRIDLAADVDNDVTISIHQGRDFADSVNYDLTSALTKRIDADWVVGNNSGGMATGLLAASTTYFIYAILGASGSPLDVGFDTSSTAVNILATAGASYTKYREIGKLRTDASSKIESLLFKTRAGYRAISKQFLFESAPDTPIFATVWTHALGAVPMLVEVYMRCVTADGNYLVGDRLPIVSAQGNAGSVGTTGMVVISTSSEVRVSRIQGANNIQISDRPGGGASHNIDDTDWRYEIVAES